MTRSFSSALPAAHVVLQILIVLNWLVGVAFLALLFVAPNAQWIMSAFALTPSPEADRMIFGMRSILVLMLAMIPLNHIVLKRLHTIVATVRAGDPFVTANADRLRTIAWTLLVAQLLSLVIGAISEGLSTPAASVDVGVGFSISGWLSVLLTFVLARVFVEGELMRQDLKGTI